MKRLLQAGVQSFAGILILCSGQVVLAQDEDDEMKISLGYVTTSGNTETTTFNGEFLALWNTGIWTHNFKFQALSASDDGETTAERYFLEQKSDYNIDEMQYVFGKLSYTDDRFSGYDYQATAMAGYGRHLIKRDGLGLEVYGGLGYRSSETILGEKEDEPIIGLGERLNWDISDSTLLYQLFSTEVGDELTVTLFEVGLESVIIDRLATRIAYQARHNSIVPPEMEKLDTQTSISLVYQF